jgi:hypothetical protein
VSPRPGRRYEDVKRVDLLAKGTARVSDDGEYCDGCGSLHLFYCDREVDSAKCKRFDAHLIGRRTPKRHPACIADEQKASAFAESLAICKRELSEARNEIVRLRLAILDNGPHSGHSPGGYSPNCPMCRAKDAVRQEG